LGPLEVSPGAKLSNFEIFESQKTIRPKNKFVQGNAASSKVLSQKGIKRLHPAAALLQFVGTNATTRISSLHRRRWGCCHLNSKMTARLVFDVIWYVKFYASFSASCQATHQE
jgi:hypothetical protein